MANKPMKTLTLCGNTYEIVDEVARNDIGILKSKEISSLTIQTNGTTLGSYNGSEAKTFNITPSNIGAATDNHDHNYAGSSSVGGAATSANKVNADLIIKLNGGSTEGNNLFTFNGSASKTINITTSSIGITATTTELNVLDGITATTTELNYCSKVKSNIQDQLDSKLSLSGGTITGAIIPNEDRKLNLGSKDVHFATIFGDTFSGNALTATKASSLESSHTFITNLEMNDEAMSFNGTKDCEHGVTGVLGMENGGTGATKKEDIRTNIGITSGESFPESASEGDIFFLYG